MNMTPSERRNKAEETTREAKLVIDAEGDAHRAKTVRLRAERLAKEAEPQTAAPKKKRTRKQPSR